MTNDWIYDIETYPNVFLISFEHVEAPFKLCYEISDWRNDSIPILEFLHWLKSKNARMVGFNNIGFDYPVIHQFIKMGKSDAKLLYDKAAAIIGQQDDENRWAHQVFPSDRFIEQIDLYKIHHFDNRAKATSLKVLEFNMRSNTIVDLPFPFGSTLTREQVEVLKHYNQHDVAQTKLFYHHTLPMIRFREELTRKYNRDFMNHNDTKIGKDYFIMKLEESGVACYEYIPDKGRKPRQTRRSVIHLKDAILPWIQFEQPELTRVLGWLKEQSITETKGVFKDITAVVNGFTFVFGLGGIHGSVEKKIIETDVDTVIIDLDVSSMYPNIAITNGLYPAHLGKGFVSIYKQLYEVRKQYPKKSAESEMLKLALNGTYGDSNNGYSVFYDPLFTMSITLNSQLLICVLAEQLMKIPGLELLQANTDGISFKIPKTSRDFVEQTAGWWEQLIGLTLETVEYKTMYVRDVNSYIAVKEDGTAKRRGAYGHDRTEDRKGWWSTNESALVVPKVAEKVLVEGAPIRQTVEMWPDIMDFMLRTKVPRSSYLTIEHSGQEPITIQNVSRYYVAVGGGHLFKMMPPLKKKEEPVDGNWEGVWRKIGIESGWGVQVCNDIKDVSLPVDFSYYVREVEKLVNGLA